MDDIVRIVVDIDPQEEITYGEPSPSVRSSLAGLSCGQIGDPRCIGREMRQGRINQIDPVYLDIREDGESVWVNLTRHCYTLEPSLVP